MARAKDLFKEAFKISGGNPEAAKTYFYDGLSSLAKDVEEIIALLQDIKIYTRRSTTK